MSEAFLIIQDVAIVIAAFTGSAATAFYSFKAIAKQHKLTVEQADKQHQLTIEEADKKTRSDAYVSLLSTSQNFVIKLDYLNSIITSEGKTIQQMGVREQYEWLSLELKPLIEIVSAIWLVGSAEAIASANKVLKSAGDVHFIINKDNSEERNKLLLEKEEIFTKIRRDFAVLARKELGSGAVSMVDNSKIENSNNRPTTNPTTPMTSNSNEN